MQTFFRTGIFLFFLGLVAMYYDKRGYTLPLTQDLDIYLFLMGTIPVTIFATLYVISFFSGRSWRRARSKSRCVRCGTRISKGELYCEYHKGIVYDEYEKEQRGDDIY